MTTLRQAAALRRFVTIGQRWRRRSDRAVFEIRQVYRADRGVLVRDEATGEQFEVWMVDLLPGRGWLWIAPAAPRRISKAEEAITT